MRCIIAQVFGGGEEFLSCFADLEILSIIRGVLAFHAPIIAQVVLVLLSYWTTWVAYRFFILPLQLLGFILPSYFIRPSFNASSITIPNGDEQHTDCQNPIENNDKSAHGCITIKPIYSIDNGENESNPKQPMPDKLSMLFHKTPPKM
jgi:hypothetical protein